jgi:hypothetical protein
MLYGTTHTKTKAQPIVTVANLEFFRERMKAVPNLWSEFGIKQGDIEGLDKLYLASLERDTTFETLLRAPHSPGHLCDMVC